MTVDQAIDFSAPSGKYAGWVRGEIGKTATPMGAYQIVGKTLRDAKRAWPDRRRADDPGATGPAGPVDPENPGHARLGRVSRATDRFYA